VAHSCCFHGYDQAYEIEPLTHYESSDLFFERIFGSTVNCEGTPLAIVSIADRLASKPVHSKDQWQRIFGFLGAELETSPSLERLKKIATMICPTT
jgi:disease resistance protein RPM1